MHNVIKWLKRLLLSSVILINLGAIAWLLLCMYAAYYDVASKASIVSLFSFSTPFAILLNVFFIFYWVFGKRRFIALGSIIPILLCLKTLVLPTFGINLFRNNKLNTDDIELKVLSWNVHLFDLGEWTLDKTTKSQIIKFIQEEDPDILCLVEYYKDSGSYEPYDEVIRQQGYPYHYFQIDETKKKRFLNISAGKDEKIEIGSIIFSKYPIVEKSIFPLDNTNYYRMLNAVIQLDNAQKISVSLVHLQSFKFNEHDVNYVEEVKNKALDSLKVTDKSKQIVKKITHSSQRRAIQANVIDSFVKLNPYPIILCGDFNDLPGSYVYTKSRGSLSDIFVDKGIGLGRTYRRIFRTLRIDYLFYDASFFEPMGYASPNIKLSDHYPIIGTFKIKK